MKNDPCGDESTDWLREARTVLMNLGDQTIAETGSWNHVIQHLMLEHQLTLSTAESCTGGFIASQLTDLPGSSGYFLGSVVSYANSVKQNVLGVSLATLQNYGAVSPQCAEEMLSGVLRLIGSNIGVAVTG
ncbi:MAG TPA: nicotinamide-nucleotide amidohydrolase family protein, partial [Membranihabitans sp.]|nr:nicotinamide-nucleotide amidohydrolase family protein [Membranihabitans sp.]